jgi:hypothetical protein
MKIEAEGKKLLVEVAVFEEESIKDIEELMVDDEELS